MCEKNISIIKGIEETILWCLVEKKKWVNKKNSPKESNIYGLLVYCKLIIGINILVMYTYKNFKLDKILTIGYVKLQFILFFQNYSCVTIQYYLFLNSNPCL